MWKAEGKEWAWGCDWETGTYLSLQLVYGGVQGRSQKETKGEGLIAR